MPTIDTKSSDAARLNFRLPPEIKKRIESAARISGITVTDFAVSALAHSADKILREHRYRTLSDRDRDLFLALLEEPPVPNPQLRDSVRKYSERVKR